MAAAGAGVAVLSGAGRGTFSDFLADWTSALGGRLVRYQAFDHEPVRLAARQVFGVDQLPTHDFGRARYIVSFGADFLESWLGPVENARGFAPVARRRDGGLRQARGLCTDGCRSRE